MDVTEGEGLVCVWEALDPCLQQLVIEGGVRGPLDNCLQRVVMERRVYVRAPLDPCLQRVVIE